MKVFKAKNSNDMATMVYQAMEADGYVTDSRNGQVVVYPGPVTMCYTNPWHRGNFTPGRNANPFFHIAEAMWMLAGRNDVAFLTQFNKNMINYSDDGVTFNAPYGYRLRRHFKVDQLEEVVSVLRKDAVTRQAVCVLWDADDLTKVTKDKACNMLMVFSIVHNRVELMVYNRSNDAVYGGVTGANPVHFSIMQQWVADQLGLLMGNLNFVSNNLHIYTELYDKWQTMNITDNMDTILDPAYPPNMGELAEIERFCHDFSRGKVVRKNYPSPFLDFVAKPIINAWFSYKNVPEAKELVFAELDGCCDKPLHTACTQWLRRAYANK